MAPSPAQLLQNAHLALEDVSVHARRAFDDLSIHGQRAINGFKLDALTLTIILSSLTLLLILHQFILNPFYLSPMRKAPGPSQSPKSLRYILYGEFPDIMRAEAGILQRKWAKTYGPVVRAVGPLGIERMMFLSPVAMQKILVSEWVEYPRPDFMRNILGMAAGFGLLTVTGDEHRLMRRALNPAFSIPSLTAQTDMYYKPIYSLVDILKSELKGAGSGGKTFLMYDWMSKVTLDIICLTAFGYETDCLHNPNNELAEAYHDLINLQSGTNLARFIAVMAIPGIIPLLRSDWMYRHRRLLRKASLLEPLETFLMSMRRIKAVSAEMLEQKIREARAIEGDSEMKGKKDVMSLVVQARMREAKGGGEGGYRMSDAMMMEQVLTFLGAGHETTASGLAWTLWLLATHPDIQKKLRKEVTPVLEANPNPDFRTLKGMEYLDHVVMESLRVYPPVPMTIRKAGKSDYIEGIYVPKGTLLYIPIRVINTYQGFWGDDAEDFRPERWDNLPSTVHSAHSFQSFINGPHHCIGRTMAIVEMKAVLAIIIAHFEFEPAYDGQVAHPTAAVTMKPADNLPLRVRAVTKA